MMKKLILLLCLVLVQFSFVPPNITWVAIGDSITYLNDHPNETGNRTTKGYMTRVVEKMPHINFVNQGHNGWTAIKIATEIENLGIQKADVYSIFLGTMIGGDRSPWASFLITKITQAMGRYTVHLGL
jgi:hypothetical protein